MLNDIIIDEYGAREVKVQPHMLAWMRSNHAGETGAVWIYRGARCVVWNKQIRDMATEHGNNEQRHLMVMNHLVAREHQSRLLPIWRISGFTLGFVSAVFGYRAFCITIEAVETFVEMHYQEQIRYLAAHEPGSALRAVLQRCCDEEVEHQHDAASRHGDKRRSMFKAGWQYIIGTGSDLAVRLAKVM